MKRSKGFTITEMVVVVAVIAVLAGMMLPALGYVKRTARETECMNNMRGLSQTMIMYQTSNDGRFPAYNKSDSLKDYNYSGSWVEALVLADEKGQLEFDPAMLACPERPEVGHMYADTKFEKYFDGKDSPFAFNPTLGGAGSGLVSSGKGTRATQINDSQMPMIFEYDNIIGPWGAASNQIAYNMNEGTDGSKVQYFVKEVISLGLESRFRPAHGNEYSYTTISGNLEKKSQEDFYEDYENMAKTKYASMWDNAINEIVVDNPTKPSPTPEPTPIEGDPAKGEVDADIDAKTPTKTGSKLNTSNTADSADLFSK